MRHHWESVHRFVSPAVLANTETYKDKRAPTSTSAEGDTAAGRRIRVRRRRWGIIVIVCALLAYVAFWVATAATHDCLNSVCTFPPIDNEAPGPRAYRHAEDTFAGFKHRGGSCDVSSLDLHRPFGPLCPDKDAVLVAMSGGGRAGVDAPYVPRGCDMRWYDTRQACEILNRYSQVVLVGDSMLRHLIGALNVLLREDLGYGGVTD